MGPDRAPAYPQRVLAGRALSRAWSDQDRLLAAGGAMAATIGLMILLDVVHPPAVATSLAFAFRAGDETNLGLFRLAVGMIAVLVILERILLWRLGRYQTTRQAP